MVTPAAPAPLGLDTRATSLSSLFLLPLENARLQTYLRRRLQLAQEAAGFGGANQLLGDAVVTAPGGTLTIEVPLSQRDGGQGASLTVTAQVGLGKLGFAQIKPVPGAATAGTSLTVREQGALFGDVLTLLNNALGTGNQTSWLTDPSRDFRCVHVIFLGTPPASAPTWNAGSADLGGTAGTPRSFRWWGTVTHATDTTIQVQGNWITSIVSRDATGAIDVGTTCHELSHTLGMVDLPPGVPGERCLGLPDTYDNDPENQNQLRYLDGWDVMAAQSGLPHLVGHHKRHLGWITPGRIQAVALPVPSGPTGTECWLVPVEYWDATMESRVRAAVVGLPGASLPISQLMNVALPGDGGRMLMVEARAAGTRFSQQLPFQAGRTVALLVTDAIACSDPTRYVVDFKYRRFVHPLNLGTELDTVGDTLDLSTVPELTYEGTRVTVVARQDVGGVPVLRTRIDRDTADFIDLKFTDANPPWQCPDIWVDWLGNGPTTYPDGSPYDQGEAVRFPKTGTEPHRIVARVHNGGTVDALNVDVRFYLCEPSGAGDQGQFRFLGNSVLGSVAKGTFALADVPWNVSSANTEHQCVLAQIADWDIPQQAGGGPVPVFEATTDLWLSNNRGQKNIIDFQLKAGSPYQPHVIPLQIANDGPQELEVYLEPVGLPAGVTITCTPRSLRVPPQSTGQFLATVTGNTAVLPIGAASDATFLIHACRWTRDRSNVEAFGGWQMTLRPRQATTMTISASAAPPGVTVTGTVGGRAARTTSGCGWRRDPAHRRGSRSRC